MIDSFSVCGLLKNATFLPGPYHREILYRNNDIDHQMEKRLRKLLPEREGGKESLDEVRRD